MIDPCVPAVHSAATLRRWAIWRHAHRLWHPTGPRLGPCAKAMGALLKAAPAALPALLIPGSVPPPYAPDVGFTSAASKPWWPAGGWVAEAGASSWGYGGASLGSAPSPFPVVPWQPWDVLRPSPLPIAFPVPFSPAPFSPVPVPRVSPPIERVDTPEPASIAILALGAGAAILTRRKPRCRA